MYDKRLIAFIKAADCQSITKASEELYISPNSVSRQIQELEQEWNTTLFNRNSHGVFLTAEGKYFYDHALDIIQMSDTIISNIPKENYKTVIRIGFTFTTLKNNIVSVCKNYQNNHPEVSISLLPLTNFSKFDIDLKEYDLFFSPHLHTANDLIFRSLFSIPFECLVSPLNSLSSQSKIKISDLQNEKIYFLKKGFLPDLDILRKQFINYNISDIEDLSCLNNQDGVLIIPAGIYFPLNPGNSISLDTEIKLQYGLYTSAKTENNLYSLIQYIVQNVKCN